MLSTNRMILLQNQPQTPPPDWRNNPLAAETPSRLEEQSADCGNVPQIGGTIRWLRKRPPDWRNNPLTAETPSRLEEQFYSL